jgi:hypothetical protein
MKQRVVLTLPLQESSMVHTRRTRIGSAVSSTWSSGISMSSSICKRTLDRFTPCRTEFEPPSKTGSLAGGGVVYLHVEEKSPSLLTPKHRSKASPISRELQCRCIWVGQRFGGFPDLREKVFLSTMPGAVYPAGRGLFFLSSCTWSSWLQVSRSDLQGPQWSWSTVAISNLCCIIYRIVGERIGTCDME